MSKPIKVQKGNAPIGPSKKTSKLALITKETNIETIKNFLPLCFLLK